VHRFLRARSVMQKMRLTLSRLRLPQAFGADSRITRPGVVPTPLAVTALHRASLAQAIESAYEQHAPRAERNLSRRTRQRISRSVGRRLRVLFLAGYRGSTFYDMSRNWAAATPHRARRQVPVGGSWVTTSATETRDTSTWLEPFDLGLCVAMSNDLMREVTRSIEWTSHARASRTQ